MKLPMVTSAPTYTKIATTPRRTCRCRSTSPKLWWRGSARSVASVSGGRRDDQPPDHALRVAGVRHDASRRDRHQEVGAEEGELDEHRPGVVHLEHRLQMRNQHVVEAGETAPGEEEDGKDRDRGAGGESAATHGLQPTRP